jgi:hypothetical protein
VLGFMLVRDENLHFLIYRGDAEDTEKVRRKTFKLCGWPEPRLKRTKRADRVATVFRVKSYPR